jgi:hypothetical protein
MTTDTLINRPQSAKAHTRIAPSGTQLWLFMLMALVGAIATLIAPDHSAAQVIGIALLFGTATGSNFATWMRERGSHREQRLMQYDYNESGALAGVTEHDSRDMASGPSAEGG